MKAWICCSALSLALGTGTAAANQPAAVPASGPVRTLGAMVVSADQSAPPIWEFTRGEKKVWILGTFPLLPEGMKFNASGIESRIAQSDVVLGPPGLVVGADIGLFRGLTLWPSIHRAKFNPDNKSLRDVLSAATYAKWKVARARFLGGDDDVDRLRPMYAAYELFKAAKEQAHASMDSAADPVIERAARRQNVPRADARYRLAIREPKDAVKRFNVSGTDDISCLEDTLDRIEPFVQTAAVRGDAWASGDLTRLSEFSNSGSELNFCWARLTNQAIGVQQGFADIDREMDARWLGELQTVLASHDTVFTTLAVKELIGSTGLAAALQRDGFQVKAPDVGSPSNANP
jgi:hypothetical protein